MLEVLRLEKGVEEIAAEEKGDSDKQNISDHSWTFYLSRSQPLR
jgi:hypothetical protein